MRQLQQRIGSVSICGKGAIAKEIVQKPTMMKTIEVAQYHPICLARISATTGLLFLLLYLLHPRNQMICGTLRKCE
jgi:hypothetical protein